MLEDKLGLLLLQLAPGMRYDPERLKAALLTFGDAGKAAVEFRDHRWLTGEVKDVLKESGAVFCAVDSPKSRLVDWVTAEVAYIRLHGRQRWYNYDYSTAELREIAVLARRLVKRGANTVYIFFNNSVSGYAPQNALAFMKILQ